MCIYPATPGLRFDTGTNMIPMTFPKTIFMFCRVSASRWGRAARNARRTRRVFSEKPVTNRSDRTRSDWLAHYFNGGLRYSRGTERTGRGAEAASNLFGSACPARLCPIIATRRCKCATIFEIERVYPPGDTAIPWIKFRIAVNLDHLLRREKHNFKLSFANIHGLSVSSPRCRTNSSSPGELPTTDGGFEKSYLFMRNLSQIASFVGFTCQEELRDFSRIFRSRRCRAVRYYWEMEKLYRNSAIDE